MASPAESQLIDLIVAGSLLVVTLIGFIIFYFFLYQRKILIIQQEKRKKEMEMEHRMVQAQFESQEQERTRIAQDLHDSLSSFLWGAKVNATFIQRSTPMDREARESFDELNSILDQSIDTVRRISRELAPEAFIHAGLSRSLQALCERFDGKDGRTVSFRENENRVWSDARALHVYRIGQELVTNAIRHSDGTVIVVSLHWKPGVLELTVSDDGKGLGECGFTAGVGWWSIRQRANHLSAGIHMRAADAETNTGTYVMLLIPLPA